jgi:hypothetical protein
MVMWTNFFILLHYPGVAKGQPRIFVAGKEIRDTLKVQ